MRRNTRTRGLRARSTEEASSGIEFAFGLPPGAKFFDRDSRQPRWEPPVFVSDANRCLRSSEREIARFRDSSFLTGKLYSCQATWPIMENLILDRIPPGHSPAGGGFGPGAVATPADGSGAIVPN